MNKTKLAVALAATLPFVANAATLATFGDAPTFQNEVLAVANETVDDADFSYSPAIALGVGSRVTFTFSNAPIRSDTGLAFPFASTINGDGTGVLQLGEQTATSVTYLVQAAAAADEVFEIIPAAAGDKPDFAVSGMTANTDVTVSSAVTNSVGTDLDDDGAALTLIDALGDRYAVAVPASVETIDVQTDAPKTTFVGGGTTSTLGVTIASAAGATHAVDAAAETITLTGDFSWLDRDDETDGVQLTAASVEVVQTGGDREGFATVTDTTTAAGLAAVTGGTITITFDHDADATAYTVNLVGPGDIVIPRQTVSASYSVASATEAVLDSASGNDVYGINGSTVSVYAVPVSNSVQNFIYLDNSSASSGLVSVSVIDDGNTYGPYELGTVGPNEVFDVGGRFLGAVNTAGEVLSGGRVRLDIVTEVASTDVDISASYKVISANDRLNLETSALQDVVDTINANTAP